MSDFRLKQTLTANVDAISLDWLKTPLHLIDETHSLQTAVILALGTDRLANPDDILPDITSDDRRGWWGDLQAEEIWGGWPVGSRLWLIGRAKITGPGAREGATVARVEAYIREALQPFLENGIASRMTVNATRTEVEEIDAEIVLYRGPKPLIALRYQGLWDEVTQ